MDYTFFPPNLLAALVPKVFFWLIFLIEISKKSLLKPWIKTNQPWGPSQHYTFWCEANIYIKKSDKKRQDCVLNRFNKWKNYNPTHKYFSSINILLYGRNSKSPMLVCSSEFSMTITSFAVLHGSLWVKSYFGTICLASSEIAHLHTI